MREIVLDTETTGFDPKSDRIVEIGCVEVENYIATGKTYHVYINPCRDVPDEAARVHGLTTEFLADKPIFAEIIDGFLEFIGEDPFVIHNASFDMGFLNAELVRHGFPVMPASRAFDTLAMARKKFPGSPASLDALCKRFEVDSSARAFHGALLDAELLAEVYLELRGGREPGLAIGVEITEAEMEKQAANRQRREPRLFPIPEQDLAAHEEFLKEIKNPLWKVG